MTKTVLVCDDAAFMRRLITGYLTGAGHKVIGEAPSGEQAVEKYKELQPDLVTMDIVMPGMSGVDAVKEIVADYPDAKILMCTAIGQDQLVAEAKEAGAKGFVVKPFQAPDFLAAVSEILEPSD